MFESSLVESRNLLRTNNRWTTAISLTIQVSIVAVLIALPLLHPEALPIHSLSVAQLVAPPPPSPPPPQPPVRVQAAPAAEPYTQPIRPVIQRIPTASPIGAEPPIISIPSGDLSIRGSVDPLIALVTPRPIVVVSPAPASTDTGPLRVSKGVATGMLLTPLHPVYPRIAIAIRTEGTVVIEAIISKTGNVESARVISGPPMLQNAALDAVRSALYAPFKLNGDPVEVQTTFSVNFKLND